MFHHVERFKVTTLEESFAHKSGVNFTIEKKLHFSSLAELITNMF